MSIAPDSLRQVMLSMHTVQPIRAGAASDVVIEGDKLHWTQEVSDTRCEATATVKASTGRDPATMNGKLLCGDGQLTFALRKTE